MPLSRTPAPNKRKKTSRIITDLAHVTQDEYDSEPEASEFDLGTKIRTPKDIMLEELSLLKNKGSKMFRMRKQRVEKFIYENNPDVFVGESMENLQKFVPSLGGQMMDLGGHLVGGQMVGQAGGGGAPVPPPKPGSYGKGAGAGGGAGGKGGAGGGGGAGHGGHHQGEGSGAGGVTVDGQAQGDHGDKGKKKLEYIKTYVSPWERAMKGNEELTATLRGHMPGPLVHHDLPKYKCFNRSALPYGGFEKASQLMTFQLPDIEAATEELEPAVMYQHDLGSRPSFNRTPIGWVGCGEPATIPVQMETMPFDGETDDL